MSALVKDFDVLTEDGSTEINNIPVSTTYSFFVAGDFDGGVASLEVSPNKIDWFTVNQLTKSGRLIQWISSGEKVRVTLSGSNGAANLKSGVRQ